MRRDPSPSPATTGAPSRATPRRAYHRGHGDAARRHDAYVAAMHETARGLLHHLALNDLLTTIVTRAGALLDTPHGFIDLVPSDTPAAPPAVIGIGVFAQLPPPVLCRGVGVSGTVWETGAPLVIADYAAWAGRMPPAAYDALRAVAAVPLRSATTVIGVLGVAAVEPGRRFTTAAMVELQRFADLAAVALEHGRLDSAARVALDERERADAALRASESRYRQLFENHPAVQWLVDAATGAIVDANPAACAFYGYPRDALMQMHVQDFNTVSPKRVLAALALVQREYHGTFLFKHRLASGEVRDVEVRSGPLQSGDRPLVFSVIHDITERVRVEEQLRYRAGHDLLTGLPNRALLTERLDRALKHSRRRTDPRFAVLFVDPDRFKQVNDSLGHVVGDALLTDLARRLDGDEFAVLAENLPEASAAVRLAERIHAAFAAPITFGEQEIVVTASIGIALSAPHYTRAEELLRDADTAMHRAKALGPARHVVFDTTMHTRARTLLRVENELRRAIERDELAVHYQPIVGIADGSMMGVEALVRWQPSHSVPLAPDAFLAVAEETGLIVPLDRWVLRAACCQMGAWAARFPAYPHLTASVNISGVHLLQPDFLSQVWQTLADTALPAERLVLEITESALIAHAEVAVTMLHELRAAGVCVHLDDFGMGYSSLSYLRQFPVDALKIDRSFISGEGETLASTAIVAAMVALAHNLAMHVTAEGVETMRQWARLRAIGCDFGQGYLFARPQTAEDIAALLAGGGNIRAAMLATS